MLNAKRFNRVLFLLLWASIAALVFAYVGQYFFDLQPCVLCFYQRKPFFAIIVLILICLGFFKSQKSRKVTFYLCLLLLFTNCVIAFYHVGVEQKIFAGPSTCSSDNLNQFTSVEDLRDALANTKAVRCDEPSFVFLGLSMAAWNFVYCLLLIIALSQIRLFR